MNRETIFSERERFSGKAAEIIENCVWQIFRSPLHLPGVNEPGIKILIAAASYLSFPTSNRWKDKRERRENGMEKSSVPE